MGQAKRKPPVKRSTEQVPASQTSPCVSKRHNDYDCLIRWGVSRKKHTVDRWCDPCREHHASTGIVKAWRK